MSRKGGISRKTTAGRFLTVPSACGIGTTMTSHSFIFWIYLFNHIQRILRFVIAIRARQTFHCKFCPIFAFLISRFRQHGYKELGIRLKFKRLIKQNPASVKMSMQCFCFHDKNVP